MVYVVVWKSERKGLLLIHVFFVGIMHYYDFGFPRAYMHAAFTL